MKTHFLFLRPFMMPSRHSVWLHHELYKSNFPVLFERLRLCRERYPLHQTMSFVSKGNKRSRVDSRICQHSSSYFSRQLSSSSEPTFEPPEPPKSHGHPVFPDIQFQNASPPTDQSNFAFIRNSDPEAVFVVNGSSRGIGLQFVKSLAGRTKVSNDEETYVSFDLISPKLVYFNSS